MSPETLKIKKTYAHKDEITKLPNFIEDYNKNARGVDYCNRMTTQFRYPYGSRKW